MLKRGKVKGVKTFQVREGPGVPGERRSHQRLMQERTRACNRERERLGVASVPCPHVLNKAGDSMPRTDYLGSDMAGRGRDDAEIGDPGGQVRRPPNGTKDLQSEGPG